jgi:hypothetical protein
VVTVVLLLFVVILGVGTSLMDVASGGVPQTDGSRTNGSPFDEEGDSMVGVTEGEGVWSGVAETAGDSTAGDCCEMVPSGRL